MIFGISPKKNTKSGGVELIFYSKVLFALFSKLFYNSEEKRAWTKCMPQWMLFLPLEKQAEILRGWWRGDSGYTVSQKLADQMKILCIRLWVIPSISIDFATNYALRGKHVIDGREITTNKNTVVFSNLSFFRDDYTLLDDVCFKKFRNKRNSKHGWMDENYAYLPVKIIKERDYVGNVFNLEVADDNSYATQFAVVHNCWTPWFSLFGSNSGFNNVEECFQDKTKHIFALETGLSSDPAMNWRLSALDRYALVSNSDCHSFWPWRIGREVNVFDMKDITYKNFISVMKDRDPKKFLYTIEVNPNYGKYHFDGHRSCNVCMNPSESNKLHKICPVCKRPMTIGVLNRVEELADREDGYVPKNSIPFKTLMPLTEILSAKMGVEQLFSKKIWSEYQKLIDAFGSEYNILLNVSFEQLKRVISEPMAKAIIDIREGLIEIKPGYDGVYGYPVFEDVERKHIDTKISKDIGGQKSLMDYK